MTIELFIAGFILGSILVQTAFTRADIRDIRDELHRIRRQLETD